MKHRGEVKESFADRMIAKINKTTWHGYGNRRNDECEHGLSLELCDGPGHYPPDNWND